MSTISASTTSTTGYVVTSDTTGTLVLKTGSTPTTAVTVGTDQSVTLAGTLAVQSQNISPYTGMKNRIINGGMQINQRGSTVTTLNDVTAFYPVDRYTGGSLSDGSITGEQSTDAPTGFTNSIKYAVTSADSSLSSTQYARLYYQIEGLNVSDLAWGSASAATVTLSFWTKSSVTGTFGGTIQNNARDRSYAFSYTINSANTWEQKSITITGDQSGTWLKDNGVGLRICFGLAAGSSYQQASTNTWQATGVQFAPSTALNLLATNGATWYIAGLQLEKGSTATSFDYRPYGTELALCQRYFLLIGKDDIYTPLSTMGVVYNTTTVLIPFVFPVKMRTSPSTFTISNAEIVEWATGGNYAVSSYSTPGGQLGTQSYLISVVIGSASLGVGRAAQLRAANSSAAYISFSSEL